MFCPLCGKEVAEEQMFCQHCGAKLREDAGYAEQATAPQERDKTAWEDRERYGSFRGLVNTLNEVLFRPSEFYRKMPVVGGLTEPLLYALIVGMVGLMFSYMWQIATRGTMESMMPGMPAGAGHEMLQGTGLAFLAFFSPLIVILGLFLSAGILHVCLLLVRGTTAGFEGTFRVVSYGYSVNLFLVVPFCGYPLMVVWAIVLYIIGLKEAHRTTGGKAAFAVFLPVIACTCLVVFAITMLLGAAAASFGTLLQMQK